MAIGFRFFAVLSTLALLPATTAMAADAITVNSARVVVDAVELAMKRNSPQEIAGNLSADCIIKVTGPMPDGSRRVHQVTRQQFVDAAEEDAKHDTDYHYESTVQKVSIANGNAVAQVQSTTSYTDNGKNIREVENAVETLELRRGRVFVTAVDAQEVGLTVDGKRLF